MFSALIMYTNRWYSRHDICKIRKHETKFKLLVTLTILKSLLMPLSPVSCYLSSSGSSSLLSTILHSCNIRCSLGVKDPSFICKQNKTLRKIMFFDSVQSDVIKNTKFWKLDLFMWDFRFSRWRVWSWVSSGMYCCVLKLMSSSIWECGSTSQKTLNLDLFTSSGKIMEEPILLGPPTSHPMQIHS
jgi:hypothetical protein